MIFRRLVTGICLASVLSLCACGGSGNSGSGDQGKKEEEEGRPVIPIPIPLPIRSKTVVSTLSDEQILSVHECLLGAFSKGASTHWNTIGGGELMKCLMSVVQLHESDLTAQFEFDFAGLFAGLHESDGTVASEISVRRVKQRIYKGG